MNPNQPDSIEPNHTDVPAETPTPSANPSDQVSTSQPLPETPIVQPTIGAQPVATASKKKIGLAGIVTLAAVLLFTGTVAGYFGFILPNKPENIWEKSLDNTAKGYDKLIEYTKENKDVKGGTVKGNFKIDSSELVVDGTIDGKFDNKTSDIKMDIGAVGTRLNIDIRSTIPEGASNPDIYARVNGLDGLDSLLGGEAGAYLDSINNQWYFIDHTLLDQLEKEAVQGTDSGASELTPDDGIAILEAVGRVNDEYLFTIAPDKAVLKVHTNVGKEDLDGRSSYHYKVGYEKEQLKAYVTAMKDELKKTKLKELLGGDNFEEAMDIEGIIKAIDESDGKGEADVWVDMETKLIRQIRFTDSDNKDNYLDIGLDYDGGDEYPFFIKFVSNEEGDQGTADLRVTLNTKTDTTTLDASLDYNASGAVKGNLKLDFVQSDEVVEFVKPEGARSLNELLGGLLGGFNSSGSLEEFNPETLGAFDFL